MEKRLVYVLAGTGLFVALVVLLILILQKQSSTIRLTGSFESNSFRMAYPESWQDNIPQTNILFLGSPEVLHQQAGASMLVQRSIALTSDAETLQEALQLYLERGPLRIAGKWSIVGDITTIKFAERDALQVILEGADNAEAVPMHSEIIVTRADNSIVYVFAMSAPVEQWDTIEPTFAAMLASVEILE